MQSRTHRTSNASEDGNKSQSSITSPQQQQPHQGSGKPAENPWKSRQAAALFDGQERGAEASRGNTYNDQPRSYNNERRGGGGGGASERSGYNKRPDSHGNRGSYNNRDSNRGGNDRRGGSRGSASRGGAYNSQDNRPYKNYNEPRQQRQEESNDIGFANKFAGLKVDVDEVEWMLNIK